MKKSFAYPSTEPSENSFDYLIQKAVEKALLNVSEPLIETVVERVIQQKLYDTKDEPLSIEQTAEFLHKKKQTIYNYVSKGLIPFHKSGAQVIFFRKELVEWLKNS
jgi:excisionase family DNA binding protein